MTYQEFVNKVLGFFSNPDAEEKVRIRHDRENGRYIAKGYGIVIIGRFSSDMVTVRYGSGHQVMVNL